MIIVLDAGPLGILTNPKATPLNLECRQWMKELLLKNCRVILPEIADYEVRRELIRAKRLQGIQRLDNWKSRLEYQPLTTATMLKAAEFWAEARQTGKPTASPEALDGDVILAAQASLIAESQGDRMVVIATTNVGHFEDL
ncbi:MAG: type II toxin-antitoxin system VapC family toxin [Pseudanabaena sp.]